MNQLVDVLLNFSGPTPYILVFLVLLACGLGVPIPEDITLFAAGIISYYGSADVTLMIIVCFVGVMVGDSTMYAFGAVYGRKLTRKAFFQKLIPAHKLAKMQTRLRKDGNKVIFAARFMPGLRAPIFFSSGMLHIPAKTFLLFDGSAALISVPTIVYLVYHFGDEVDRIIKIIKDVQFGIVGLVVIVLGVIATKIYFELRDADE
jgi:membrane protein DedA with SNARE-associated domain